MLVLKIYPSSDQGMFPRGLEGEQPLFGAAIHALATNSHINFNLMFLMTAVPRQRYIFLWKVTFIIPPVRGWRPDWLAFIISTRQEALYLQYIWMLLLPSKWNLHSASLPQTCQYWLATFLNILPFGWRPETTSYILLKREPEYPQNLI